MRLLILGNWHALSNAAQYAKAFRQEGHEAITCGPQFNALQRDALRWKTALLRMEWPPSNDAADAYIAHLLAESPTPDIMTPPRGLVVPGDYGNFDAVIAFDAYGETPLVTPVKTDLPVAVVCGDTHTGWLAQQAEEAKGYDHVFVQFRRADLARFEHPSKQWLPAAADPDVWVHVPDAAKRYDVLFVGATDPRVHIKRVELLHFLKRELGEERVVVKHLFGELAALAMNRARVVLNCSLAGDLNMRVPEAVCTGAALVTDDVDGLEAVVAGGYWPYQTNEEALEAVQTLLASPPGRGARATARESVLAKHTYRHRARQILAVLFGGNDAQQAGGVARYAVGVGDFVEGVGAAAPLVSLIIPAYNHWEDCTAPLLCVLHGQTDVGGVAESVEIIVVDDGSTEDVGQHNHASYDQLVVHETRKGFAAACNAGAAAARGKYLVFLNNDTEPRIGWLAPLVEALEKDAGIVGPWLKFPDGRTQSAGLARVARGMWSNLDFLLYPAEDGPYEVKAVTGACLAIRRDDLWRLGGFDDGFIGGGGCEDVDLCLRARDAGLVVKVVPSSVVVHREGSTRAALPETPAQVAHNQQRLLERWRQADERLVDAPFSAGDEHGSDFVSGCGVGADVAHCGRRRVEVNTDDVVAGVDRVSGGVLRSVPGASGVGAMPDSGAERPRSLTVVWEGNVLEKDAGSLAVINLNAVKALNAGGLPVATVTLRCRGTDWYERRDDLRDDLVDVWVTHYWPGVAAHHPPPENVRHWIVVQPWEGMASVPEAWRATWNHPTFRRLLTPSEHSKRFFVAAGVPAEKVVVIPNGVDLSVFTPDGPRLPMASGTESVFRVLFVGGLIERKGIDLLYEAWRRAFRPDEAVRLVLKAQGMRTFYSHNTVLPPSGLSNVQLLDDDGFTPEQMAKLYRSCDLYVSTSRGEAFQLSVLEAMACGRPVVVPHGGPWDEYVPDAACLQWNRNPEALAKILRWCVERCITLAELGAAAGRAAQAYSWEAIAGKYADVIREVADV